MQIAVDGPASGGKSTVSKLLAAKFSFIYLDTGAMYRSAAYIKLTRSLEGEALYSRLRQTEFIFGGHGSLILSSPDGSEDVTIAIRTPEITAATAAVSADARLRRILTDKQREIAGTADIIMDGRDIGTVVLPDADLKFFLTASPEERARRRTEEWKNAGGNVSYQEILEDILRRDKADTIRDSAPLKKADDAKEIDTTLLTIDKVVEIISVYIRELTAKQ
jgi:cytidylate kinase